MEKALKVLIEYSLAFRMPLGTYQRAPAYFLGMEVPADRRLSRKLSMSLIESSVCPSFALALIYIQLSPHPRTSQKSCPRPSISGCFSSVTSMPMKSRQAVLQKSTPSVEPWIVGTITSRLTHTRSRDFLVP